MCFLRSPLLPGWLKLNKKMVEYEPLLWEGWQEDATLFPTAEPNGLLNFDELLDCKINDEVPLDTGFNDLGWLDQKVDFSTLLPTPATEDECRLIDDAFNLLLESGNIDSYLPSDLAKDESSILGTNVNDSKDQAASSDHFSYAAPCYEAISEAGSPAPSFVDKAEFLTSIGTCSSPLGQVVPADFCQSPSYSSTPRSRLPSDDIPQSPNETSYTLGGQSAADEYCQSPDFSSFLGSPETSDVFSPVASELTSDSIDEEPATEPSVSVMVYDADPETILSDSDDLSIEEVTRSVKRRKYVSDGAKIPKVRVSLDHDFHPYKKPGGRPRNKNDRKKVQNKEAAARYRMKKKLEQRGVMDEVSTLESQQKDLQEKHDSLVSEIKYLKSLMCEILQKKGVLK